MTTVDRYTAGDMAVAAAKRLSGTADVMPGSRWHEVVAERGIEITDLHQPPDFGQFEIRLENGQRFTVTVAEDQQLLEPAVATRTIVDLPEPRVGSAGERWWTVHERGEVAYDRHWDDGSVQVETPHGDLSIEDAERYGLALIAAAREARRLAADELAKAGESDG